MKLADLDRKVIACTRCPRLRKHCLKIAKEKRRQFIEEKYWGLPIPGFGDPKAQLFILGLAPAAHGANRTGRVFTGDNSGVWLYRALFKAGFSNQAESRSRDDGLVLNDAYITCTVRCAPPENRPLPEEVANCSEYLDRELELFQSAKVYLVLGQIALKSLWARLPKEVKLQSKIPTFRHGLVVPLRDGRKVLCSYHPSQQNTFTKRLTEPMFDEIFLIARQNFI